MVKLVAFLLSAIISGAALAQAPTSGLYAQYDMVTITGGGTTLVDQSGNARHGTLHGTTLGAKGISFNGSSDYIDISTASVGNANFTVVIIASTDSNSGRLWSENNTTAGAPGMGFTRANGSFNNGSTLISTTLNLPSFLNDWHCFYMRRSESTVTYGVYDMNLVQTVDGMNVAIATGSATLGAQHYTATANSHFAGTIGYAYIYNRAKTTAEIAAACTAARTAMISRGVFMRDTLASLFPGRVWQRQGRVLAAANNADSTIGYTTTDCMVVANPCYQLWYDQGTDMHYAEAKNHDEEFTPYGLIASNYTQGQVTKVSGFAYKYMMLATPNPHTGSKDALTSNDPVNFTLARAGAIPKSVSGWDQDINNSSCKQIVAGGTVYCLYDGIAPATLYYCGGATAGEDLIFTKATANPISGYGDGQGCGGPHLQYVPGSSTPWHAWSHDNTVGNSGIFRRQSAVFNSIWNVSSPGAVFGTPNGLRPFRTFTAESPDEMSQLASWSMVEVNGQTIAAYAAANASNVFHIKTAVAPMPLSALVQTGEGTTSSQP